MARVRLVRRQQTRALPNEDHGGGLSHVRQLQLCAGRGCAWCCPTLRLGYLCLTGSLPDLDLTLRCRAGDGTPTADGEETWSTWDVLFNRDNVLADNDISNCNRQGNDGGVIELGCITEPQ